MKTKTRLIPSKRLALIGILLFFWQTNAQNTRPNPCKANEQIQKMYNANPNSKNESTQLRKKTSHLKKTQRAEPYVIPVVFHVFGTEFNNGTTVTKAIIEEALKKTDEDFQGLNADYSTIDAPFDVIKQPLNITFKLAQLDPAGNPTTGVLFYDKASGMGHYDSPEVRQVAWDNYKYCNVYITRDLYNDGDYSNSGVAWYPDQHASDNNLARVTYNGSYLASNTDENFRSVLTHEFGHYFDLPHTFDRAICNNDPDDGDGIADTPSHVNHSSNADCKVINNCLNQEINVENFMDYTDCYKMFTQGQVARMINALENSPARNTLWTTDNITATGLNLDLGAHITSSRIIFEERFENDGIIKNSLELTCESCTFTKNTGNMLVNTDYTVNNLPTGLTANIVINNNTSATINLTGTAPNHELINSVNNLSFTFSDAIITGGSDQLYKKSIDNLKISFNDAYTEYCNVNISYAVYAHITNVEFDGRSNPTGYDHHGNSNYIDNIEYPVRIGNTYPISITTNKGLGKGSDRIRIQGWFDWNNDFIYSDDELLISHVYNQTDAEGNYTYTTDIAVPNNVNPGTTAFRILAHYILNDSGDSACSNIDSGESEDYGLKIIDENATFAMNFSGNPTTVNFAEPVTFSDLTITDVDDSITTWLWTFEGGEPATSTDRIPTNISYPNEGVYDVTLEVTTAKGINQTITKTDYIKSRLKYCVSSPKFGGYFNVNHVKLETIDHTPRLSNNYDYYNTVFTSLEVGKTYPLTINTERGAGGSGDTNRVRVWADWNFDSVFSENELVLSKVVNNEDYIDDEFSFTTDITVPSDAAVGKKIGFRVIGHYLNPKNDEEGRTACGKYDSGNTSDYGIILSDALSVRDENILNTTIYPNPTKNIVSITTPSNEKMQVQVMNIFGQEMNRKTLTPSYNKSTLSLESLSNGIYFIIIEQEGKVSNNKIVISK